jgi:large subunit ribosomal protein L24
VLRVDRETGRVVVEGVNYVYRHVRRSQKHPQGGRVAKEAAIHVSNVALYCAKCSGPAKVRFKINEKKDAAGKRRREVLRLCRKCGEAVGGAR